MSYQNMIPCKTCGSITFCPHTPTDNAKLSPDVYSSQLGWALRRLKRSGSPADHKTAEIIEAHISTLERERDEAISRYSRAANSEIIAKAEALDCLQRAEAAEASLAQAQKEWDEKKVTCAARRSGTAGGNYPQDCDWPFCGCDPAADKVVETLQECGWGPLAQARREGMLEAESASPKRLQPNPPQTDGT